jgi:hypothetical protein
MRKLKLDPDTLRVESFAAREGADDAKGTVRAHSDPSAYCMETDWHWNTCGNTCENHCFGTLVEQGCVN